MPPKPVDKISMWMTGSVVEKNNCLLLTIDDSISYRQSLKCFPFLWWVDFVDEQSYRYLRAARWNSKWIFFSSWADRSLKKNNQKHVLRVFHRHTPPVPCWSDHRSLWCTPSPPVCLLDGWLYLLEKDIYTNWWVWTVLYYAAQCTSECTSDQVGEEVFGSFT